MKLSSEFGVTVLPAPVSGVQIWLADLDSLPAAQLETLSALLDPGERARAGRFHFERDRHRYAACRGLLRRLLSDALDMPASTIVIEYGAHGKPALAAGSGMRPLRFNVSHSDGQALFALSWDHEVGIDLESGLRLEAEKDLSALAERILSGRELSIWQSLADATARRAAFLRAWTRKEALAKATGNGVFDQWSRFEVGLDATSPNPSLTIRLPAHGKEPASAWLLHDLSTPQGFAAALVIEQKND